MKWTVSNIIDPQWYICPKCGKPMKSKDYHALEDKSHCPECGEALEEYNEYE